MLLRTKRHDGNLEILKAKEGGLEGAPQLKCEELMEKKWTRRWGYIYGGWNRLSGHFLLAG